MESFKLQKSKSKPTSWLEIVGTIGGIALGRYMGLGFLFLLIPGLVGWWLGSIAAKKIAVKPANIIAWSNVVTWAVPAIGIATSMFVFSFNEAYKPKEKKLTILAAVGLVASLVNSIAGIALAIKK